MNDIQLYHPYGFIISPLYSFIWYTLGSTFILIGIIYLLRKRWYNSKPTAWAQALKQIDALDAHHALGAKEFYFEASNIIKSYCAQRFNSLYQALSDQEITQALRINKDCSEEMCEQLASTLQAMRTIKFYQQQEHKQHRRVVLDYIRFFVNTTIPI